MPNNVISKITLPNGGGTYDIKDAWAREAIAALEGGSYFLGVTTSNLRDEEQMYDPRISIDGDLVSATNGNMAIYENGEFVWTKIPTYFLGHSYQGDGYYYTIIDAPTATDIRNAILTSEEGTDDSPFDHMSSEDLIQDPINDVGDGQVMLWVPDGGKWVEFGDLSQLGDLAYHDRINVTANTSGHTVNAVTSVGVASDPSVALSLETQEQDGSVSIPTAISSAALHSGTVNINGDPISTLSITGTPSLNTVVPSSGTSADTWRFRMGNPAQSEDPEALIISGTNGVIGTGVNCIGGVTAATSANVYPSNNISGSVNNTTVDVGLTRRYLYAQASGTLLQTSTESVLTSDVTFTATATDNS